MNLKRLLDVFKWRKVVLCRTCSFLMSLIYGSVTAAVMSNDVVVAVRDVLVCHQKDLAKVSIIIDQIRSCFYLRFEMHTCAV